MLLRERMNASASASSLKWRPTARRNAAGRSCRAGQRPAPYPHLAVMAGSRPTGSSPVKVGQGQSRSVKVGQGRSRSVKVSQGQSRSVKVGQGQSRSVKVSQGRSRSVKVGQGRSGSVRVGQGRSRSVKPSPVAPRPRPRTRDPRPEKRLTPHSDPSFCAGRRPGFAARRAFGEN